MYVYMQLILFLYYAIKIVIINEGYGAEHEMARQDGYWVNVY